MTWFDRALRDDKSHIDDGDRFISLWICFNSIMRAEFGENIPDHQLIENAKQFDAFKLSFNSVFTTEKFKENFEKLKTFEIMDMRDPHNDLKIKLISNDSWEDLVEILYHIRCNLFHGRKNIRDFGDDYTIVKVAYGVLLPLVEEYLSSYLKT